MKYSFLSLILLLVISCRTEEGILIVQNEEGMKLVVDGEDFMINGMNWDYFPIGTNYTYSLWEQPDEIIKAALAAEMPLLQKMGVNAIRQYNGVPRKWIQFIYEEYGIYTMFNHPFGRYGLMLAEEWAANTNYADPQVRKLLLSEVEEMGKEYKDTPGLLLYLLGNENNYGLFWDSPETEDIPEITQESKVRAKAMYQLFNEAVVLLKKTDPTRPVAICNGDLLFWDLIIEECKDMDIFGTNMYRGISFTDAFEKVRDDLGKPILFTEFGSDAFDALKEKEDQTSQAYYMVGNWKEIYENAAGMGKIGNSLGGFTFQFSDGWWKYKQDHNLEVHDTNASWRNGGYKFDYLKAEKKRKNMNEEWFGICAKDKPDQKGLYKLQPRKAYFALQKVHQFDPYGKSATLDSIENHFSKITY